MIDDYYEPPTWLRIVGCVVVIGSFILGALTR